jgi:hypothetical protein
MTSSSNSVAASAESSPIAGSVLPIQRAQELLGTLPGVISARIIASSHGEVNEIHILTTMEVTPKQTVRNVESALIAHLGMRVSHKKISVATSDVSNRPGRSTPPAMSAHQPVPTPPAAIALVPTPTPVEPAPPVAPAPIATPIVLSAPPTPTSPTMTISSAPALSQRKQSDQAADRHPMTAVAHRRLYFEDIEVRRSRTKGIACRVTLKHGEKIFVGEMEGMDNDRLRIELAARATLVAIKQAIGDDHTLALEGSRVIEAFDRQFVFAGVTAREGRDHILMTGSAEVRDSAETASVLAVLGATNRWLER